MDGGPLALPADRVPPGATVTRGWTPGAQLAGRGNSSRAMLLLLHATTANPAALPLLPLLPLFGLPPWLPALPLAFCIATNTHPELSDQEHTQTLLEHLSEHVEVWHVGHVIRRDGPKGSPILVSTLSVVAIVVSIVVASSAAATGWAATAAAAAAPARGRRGLARRVRSAGSGSGSAFFLLLGLVGLCALPPLPVLQRKDVGHGNPAENVVAREVGPTVAARTHAGMHAPCTRVGKQATMAGQR